ncbi:MAG TPA: hypothetical protein VFY20_09340, partial [Gemmatimonadales bacterium]|nr:hypothetical protein [Gemmatimonadales bacterium]
MPRLRSSAGGAAALFLALGVVPLTAQAPPAGTDSVTIAAGPQYRAGRLHRLLLGAHWRALWTAPVTVPVLDLETFDGGVTPVQRGGGLQTRSLRLRSASGREWTVRSVDKDPSTILPASLRETVLDRIVEDQTSAGHPFAALVVPPLLDAAGVLHVEPQLVRMPEDAALGEFRDFAGMLGVIEERPDEGRDGEAGFAGASEIVGTDKMLERIEERAGHAVDAPAYLRARLMDLLLGDWDRHVDQWRWARHDSAGLTLWRPIPRDRDQAFAKYDGVLLWFARQRAPQLVNFGPKYGPAIGLAWNARVLDRRLLTSLAWPSWEAEVADLQRRVDDGVIAAATASLPQGTPAGSAETLAATLRARRDGLHTVARALYDLLSGEVDVHLTDADEVVRVERLPDSTRVTVATADRTPTYLRTFLHRETDEIRLWLHGGDDRLDVQGEGGPRLRVLGGGGRDSLLSEARETRLYDRGGQWRGPDGREVAARDERWAPGDSAYPPRDWGGARFGVPVLAAGPDVGVVVGASLAWERYGFRQLPYAHRFDLRAAWAFGANAGVVEARWDDRMEQSRARVELLAR